MIKKKVLIIAPYPIENPLHGGQKRVKAIFEHYKLIFEDVKFVAVFYKKHYQQYALTDMPIEDPELIRQCEIDPFASDLICGEAIYKDQAVKNRMQTLLQEFHPDIIQIEHGYPFLGLQRIIQDLQVKPVIILSSQNVESAMKKDIFESLNLPLDRREALIKKIHNLEVDVCRQAKLVITVTKDDAAEHKKIGAQRCVVVPNGIEKTIPTKEAVAHWQKFKTEHNIKQFITFVGSAHPPNLTGFEKMIGSDLTFFPNDVHLMLAGGISEYIQQEYKNDLPRVKAFWEKASPLGKLSDDNLAGLIQESDVLTLPITSGGGSNLKTAEAILSGQKTVATDLAFRSFERYKKLPNLYFANTSEDFKKTIIIALESSKIKRTAQQEALAQQVQWQYCLEPFGKTFSLLVYGRAGYLLRKVRRGLIRLARKFGV